jgi:hypothetical protein
LTAVRFSDLPPPKERWYLIEGLVPEGYATVLYGDGGVGKSMLALSAGMAVAGRAESWLGLQVDWAPVLYLDFELDEGEQQRRAHQLARGAGLERPPESLYYMSVLGFSAQEAFDAALEECKRLGIGLLILDSLGPALEGDAEAARDIIKFHNRVLERFRAEGVTLLIIDHQSKPQSGQRYQDKRAFGSAYKGFLARSTVQAGPAEEGEGTVIVPLRQAKHNFGAKAKPLAAKLTFTETSVTVEPAEANAGDLANGEQSSNAEERVLRALEALGGTAYPEDLVQFTELAIKTVQNQLTKLRRRGTVVPTGNTRGQAQEVSLASSHNKGRGQGHQSKDPLLEPREIEDASPYDREPDGSLPSKLPASPARHEDEEDANGTVSRVQEVEAALGNLLRRAPYLLAEEPIVIAAHMRWIERLPYEPSVGEVLEAVETLETKARAPGSRNVGAEKVPTDNSSSDLRTPTRADMDEALARYGLGARDANGEDTS